MPPRFRMLIVTVVIAGLVAGVGCAKSSGSREEFCAALPETGDLLTTLGQFDGDDTAALDERFEAGAEQFRKLERAAPREIRAQVSKVGDTVEQILEVVRDHPDDLGAAREELAAKASQFLSAGKAALEVVAYASEECDVDLGATSSTAPTVSAPVTPTSTPTTG